MNRSTKRAMFLVVFSAVLLILPSQALPVDRTKLQVLEAASADPVEMKMKRGIGIPSIMKGRFCYPQIMKTEEVATSFLKMYGDALDIPASHDFVVSRVKRDAYSHKTIVYATQRMHGIPICGSGLKVHVGDNNEVTAVAGSPQFVNVDPKPTIDDLAAIFIAKSDLGLMLRYEEATTAGLVVYKGRLAWKVTVISKEPFEHWDYYVDAREGEIFWKWDNTVYSFNTQMCHGEQSANRPARLMTNQEFDNDPNIAQPTRSNLTVVHNYFLNRFGRDNMDGNPNRVTRITVQRAYVSSVGLYTTQSAYIPPDDAYDLPDEITFGDGLAPNRRPWGLSLDTCAHEYGHGMHYFEVNGLYYQDQPGALNEAFSDFWGCMVDPNDWGHGEDTYTYANMTRRLDAPSLCYFRFSAGDPNTPYPDRYRDYYLDVNNRDNGGVHINLGIPGKAFYNLAMQIGIYKTEAILYTALCDYITLATDFDSGKDAIIAAAEDLYGIGSSEANAVNTAFNSVGIEAPIDFAGAVTSSVGNLPYSTPHAYENNRTYSVTLSVPGATGLKVRFRDFQTVSPDAAKVLDRGGNEIYSYTGTLGDFTSGPVNGDTVTVKLLTDWITVGYGFDIYEIELTNDLVLANRRIYGPFNQERCIGSIVAGPSFEVESGASEELVAGASGSVTLTAGFHAKSGCIFVARRE